MVLPNRRAYVARAEIVLALSSIPGGAPAHHQRALISGYFARVRRLSDISALCGLISGYSCGASCFSDISTCLSLRRLPPAPASPRYACGTRLSCTVPRRSATSSPCARPGAVESSAPLRLAAPIAPSTRSHPPSSPTHAAARPPIAGGTESRGRSSRPPIARGSESRGRSSRPPIARDSESRGQPPPACSRSCSRAPAASSGSAI